MTLDSWQVALAIVGLAVITLVSRSFFFLSDRELPFPPWVQRGLRYAPLAALMAVVLPEVVMTNGELIGTWREARLYAVAAALAYFQCRRGILGTILVGMAVFLPLKLGLGW